MDVAITSGAAHEDYLRTLWRTHLNVPSVGSQDDFFELGGSSMQAIEMLMTVSSELARELDYAEFFKEPCIRKLAELLGP